MRGKGIDASDLSINWADLMKHKHGFTDPVPQNMEDGLTGNGVETLHGEARFTDTNRIEIDGTAHEARFFLIATGARPRPLDFPGHEHLIDSNDFLDLEALPSRILFVGGGFTSFEFAHIAARAVSIPVITDHGPRPARLRRRRPHGPALGPHHRQTGARGTGHACRVDPLESRRGVLGDRPGCRSAGSGSRRTRHRRRLHLAGWHQSPVVPYTCHMHRRTLVTKGAYGTVDHLMSGSLLDDDSQF